MVFNRKIISLVELCDDTLRFYKENSVEVVQILNAEEILYDNNPFDLICADKDYENIDWEKLKKFVGVVGITSSGVNKFPWIKFKKERIPIITSKGIISDSIAEHVISKILICTTNFIENVKNQEISYWKPYQLTDLVKNNKILVLGAGFIATRIKDLLVTFNNHPTLVSSNEEVKYNNQVYNINECPSGFFKKFDFIIDTLPGTQETKRFVNTKFLTKFRDGVIFISVGRGQNYDKNYIFTNLQNKKLSKVFLDVFETEPLLNDSEFWKINSLYVSPHSAGRIPNHISVVQSELSKRILSYRKYHAIDMGLFDYEKGY